MSWKEPYLLYNCSFRRSFSVTRAIDEFLRIENTQYEAQTY